MALETSFVPAGIPKGHAVASAPIRTVTVTEDVADVRREGTVSLAEGPQSLFLTGVTAALVDGSLWAEVVTEAGEQAEIGTVRCVRWVALDGEDRHPEEARVIGTIEDLARRFLDLRHRLERLQYRRLALEGSEGPTLRSLRRQVVREGAGPETYQALLDELLERTREDHAERFQLGRDASDLAEELGRLEKEWTEVHRLRDRVTARAGILVSLESSRSGTATLRCGYQVPCAQWRTQHEAHLLTDGKIAFMTQGVVWQATGEDWDGVRLSLSTARPSLGLDVTLPGEDVLSLREKTREEKKKIRVESRDQEVQTLGVAQPGAAEPPVPSDGGETQVYAVREKVTVLANGRAVVVGLEETMLESETQLRAAPELDRHVFLISSTRNPRPRPILAGPVALHRGGTFVGMGQVEFVASNEPFHLWWGSEDLLRVERFDDVKKEAATMFAPARQTHKVSLRIWNLGGEGVRMRVQERVPVSELQQVRIEVKELPAGVTGPDADGLLVADVQLAGREEKKLAWEWCLEADREVNADEL